MTFAMRWAGTAESYEEKDLTVDTNTEDKSLINALRSLVTEQVGLVAEARPEAEVDVKVHGHADNDHRSSCTFSILVGSNIITDQQMKAERDRVQAGKQVSP